MLAGRSLLVVEDEMLVLLNLEDILADLGCTSVSAAATVAQALGLIAAQPFDAAMVDVNLDGRKSYPVADALSARGVPFVFTTGYSGQSLNDGYRDPTRARKALPRGGAGRDPDSASPASVAKAAFHPLRTFAQRMGAPPRKS